MPPYRRILGTRSFIHALHNFVRLRSQEEIQKWGKRRQKHIDYTLDEIWEECFAQFVFFVVWCAKCRILARRFGAVMGDVTIILFDYFC